MDQLVSWVFSLFYQVICGMVNLLRFLPSFFFSFPFFGLLCYALLPVSHMVER